MKDSHIARRRFLKNISFAGMGLGISGLAHADFATIPDQDAKRIGIIGLDTSHSVAFTKALNGEQKNPLFTGFKITAAFPKGSADIQSSVSRIAGYTGEVKALGVKIVESVDDLLKEVDYVMLETNDGRSRYEQAMKVIQSRKPMFMDKPVAASLKDVRAIYAAAEKNSVPVFSSSSLRYMETVQQIISGKIGAVLGADTFSPATLEKTHPDLFWYGIHGVEILFAVMGAGCRKVSRVYTDDTDIVTGIWKDGRTGTFRGTRTGKHEYGGTVYGEKGNLVLGPFNGYDNLLVKIIEFFKTNKSPVDPNETLEIYAFMEAADKSRKGGGSMVAMG